MLSGSTDYSINRDELITITYKDLGAVNTAGTPSAAEIDYAASKLNIMLKAWMSKGLQLWVIKKAILIPERSSQVYTLGPSGDHCSLNMNKTEVRVSAAALDVTIEVDSTAGMTVNDFIGVAQDDGTIHWTTIQSITDADTAVIAVGLMSTASASAHVYFYTAKINRPNELLEVHRRVYDDVLDIPLMIRSRTDYYEQSDKDSEGVPVQYYYDPQITNSKLYNWQVADSLFTKKSVFVLLLKKPFDNLDASTDDFEFPQEWFDPIVKGLASAISRHVGRGLQDRMILKAEADEALQDALDFDVENAPISFQPDES